MSSEQVNQPVELTTLCDTVKSYQEKGYRLIQMHITPADPDFAIYYSLENRELDLVNLQLAVNSDMTIPSISSIFLCAFLYENEIHDLYGMQFDGIAVDYQGKLYQTAVKVPFGKPIAVKTAESATVTNMTEGGQ